MDDVIQTPYSGSLDHGTGEFTWAAWIKLDVVGRWQTIASTCRGTNPYTLLQVSSTNYLSFSMRDAGGTSAW